MASYIVDIQGFKFEKEFVCKEVAIVPVEKDATPTVYLFKPPFAFEDLPSRNKVENSWLERNFHGLNWDQGLVPYELLSYILNHAVHDAEKILAKGADKVIWLEKYLPFVFDLEEFGCPSLRKLRNNASCTLHNANVSMPVCAVRNANALKRWVLKYRRKRPSDFEL